MTKPSGTKAHTRRKRREGTGGVHAWLQARVDPDVRKLAEAGAAARGVTLSRYVEQLVQADDLAHQYREQQLVQGELELGETEACA
ncbi:hypothetical protein ACSNOI_03420 [Actinomadura kijaniata]|uniref:hypothetical protein n=1 Tax=Actinomadura kijaniata TaxID=46161 RepID=UPI0012F7AF9B|nr:hypothetical protein [Actinomadura kijaniata]